MGTNKFASQQGLTAYGTRRHLYDPKLGTDQPLDQATISLQMGTNKGASQVCCGARGALRVAGWWGSHGPPWPDRCTALRRPA